MQIETKAVLPPFIYLELPLRDTNIMAAVNLILRPDMKDPIPPPSMLVQLSKPFTEKLGLTTLPFHVHEVLLGFLGYHFIFNVLSPSVSRFVCPQVYRGFNKRTQINWNIHWVSMVQCLFINTAALWVIFHDKQRHEMDWRGRLWGYTPATGMVSQHTLRQRSRSTKTVFGRSKGSQLVTSSGTSRSRYSTYR